MEMVNTLPFFTKKIMKKPSTKNPQGASLALAGEPSSVGVTIKMPHGVDVLHRPASHPIFSCWVG